MQENPKVISHSRRIYRLRDAPKYLGMDVNRFNKEVRPYLTEIPIGIQGIGFDVLEIDAWLEHYIAQNGRQPKQKIANDQNETMQNKITKQSIDAEFLKVLNQAFSQKRKKC